MSSMSEAERESVATTRKRGRPKKAIPVDIEEAQTVDVSEEGRKKVGRPRKAKATSHFTEASFSEEPSRISDVPQRKARCHRDIPSKSVWGRVVGNVCREIIPSQRLPTNRVILQRYRTLRENRSNGTGMNDFANELYDEILPIWKKANIPTLDRKTCVSRIVYLLSSWREQNCSKMKPGSPKEVEYVEMLDSLFKMSHIDNEKVKEDLKSQRLLQKEPTNSPECPGMKTWEIDFAFYENQMKNPQVGTIGSRDEELEKRKKVQMLKDMQQQRRVEQEIERANETQLTATEDELNEHVGTDDVKICLTFEEDDEFIPRSEKRKPKKLDKIMLELPTKDLSKDTAVLAARLKLSHRSVTSLFAKIILSAGGDLKDFVLSKSSTYRHRITSEKEAEKKLNLKAQSLAAENPYGILHFDGKKVKYESGDVQERLIICLQQVGSEVQARFLGAPQLPDGTGAAQCEALVRYIDENGIENQLIGHCWDTTSSNTGCNIGAAVLLDRACELAHLWLACRRHTGERHCVHANNIVRGPTKSPEEQLFKHFKENFDFLDTSQIQKYKWNGDEHSPTGPYYLSTERALDVRVWAEKCCVDGTFPREDYRELLELLTHVLNGQIRRKLLRGVKIVEFKMERPGAYDHVRFMAKAIYYIKMYMLLPQLIDRQLVTEVDVLVIERMSKFIILLYGQYFLQTALTTSAPRLDLQFWRNSKRYEVIDVEISKAVVKSVHRQMFYLTEELVLLALCDKNISNPEKEELVRALLQQDRPQTFAPKKPDFKVDLLLNKSHDEPRLSHFVGSRSWLIFDLFDVNVMWMQYPPDHWANIEDFRRFDKLLNGIICVNDVAERNVRNVLEYAEYCQDPERRDRVVKVVNSHRELLDFHKFTKDELAKI